jgi:hypothetical protein
LENLRYSIDDYEEYKAEHHEFAFEYGPHVEEVASENSRKICFAEKYGSDLALISQVWGTLG